MPSGSAAAYTTIQRGQRLGRHHRRLGVRQRLPARNRRLGKQLRRGARLPREDEPGQRPERRDRRLQQRPREDPALLGRATSGTTGNVAAFGVGPACDYVLLEESYAYGGARYQFLVYQSDPHRRSAQRRRNDYWNGSSAVRRLRQLRRRHDGLAEQHRLDSDTADIGAPGSTAASSTRTRSRRHVAGHRHARDLPRQHRAQRAGVLLGDLRLGSRTCTPTDIIIWDSHGGYYGDHMHGDAPSSTRRGSRSARSAGPTRAPMVSGSAGTGFYIGPGTGGTMVANTLTNSILWTTPTTASPTTRPATTTRSAEQRRQLRRHARHAAGGPHDLTHRRHRRPALPAAHRGGVALATAGRGCRPDRRGGPVHVGRDGHAVGRTGLRHDHHRAALAVPERGRDQGRHGELHRPRRDRRPRLRDRQQPRRHAADADQVHLGVPGQSDPSRPCTAFTS